MKFLRDVFVEFLKHWRELLIGIGLALVFILLATSCSTPPTSFDPNLAAQDAQYQAERYSAMATGTAESNQLTAIAPILAITQRAADLEFQQTQVSMESTRVASLWTPTASPVPTNTPSPTLDIPATGTNVALIAIQTRSALELQKQETNNYFWAVLPIFIFAVTLLLIGYGVITYSRERKHKPLPRDEYGRTAPILDITNGRYVDQDANPNYFDMNESLAMQFLIHWLQTKYNFTPKLPHITAERQDRVKEREQVIRIEQVRHRRLPKGMIDTDGMRFLPEPDEEKLPNMEAADIPLPEWNIIQGWDGQSRPLGLGRQGIIVAQAASPHLLTTGGTGSGKTAFMLRTQATISLAKGYQVINLGFSNSGFGVFEGHPNFYSINLTESADVIDCLGSVYKELKERKEIIGGASVEWEHWHDGKQPPRPFVDVLIDELGNLADDIYTSEESSKEGAIRTRMLWRWMSMIAKEGRKVGIRFIAALQDPTAKSVDLSFRRNCTLVSFQLGDAHQSRSFIGTAGAELLQVGHFMTRNFSGNEGIVVGGGFAPTDPEIQAYLNRVRVSRTTPPNWIEGTLKQTVLPMPAPVQINATAATPRSRVDFINGLQEWQVKVLDLYEAGLTDQEDLINAVFDASEDHGVATAAVADLINRWRKVKGVTSVDVPAPAAKSAEELKIEELYRQNKSVSAIVREIWGVSGGGKYAPLAEKVKAVINQLASSSTPQMAAESA